MTIALFWEGSTTVSSKFSMFSMLARFTWALVQPPTTHTHKHKHQPSTITIFLLDEFTPAVKCKFFPFPQAWNIIYLLKG
jgi:hypothetical protein